MNVLHVGYEAFIGGTQFRTSSGEVNKNNQHQCLHVLGQEKCFLKLCRRHFCPWNSNATQTQTEPPEIPSWSVCECPIKFESTFRTWKETKFHAS